MKKNRKHLDLIGARYGRGVVIEKIGLDKNNCVAWELVCDCGKHYFAITGNLNQGHVKSCGCYNKEVVTENAKKATEAILLPLGQSARNEVIARYRKRASTLAVDCTLTIEEFENLLNSECFYCGKPPSNVYRIKHRKEEKYFYNGIDRIDSSKGYTTDNVRPCCKRCNQGKNNMSEEEFRRWVVSVYIRLGATTTGVRNGA